MMRFRQYGRTGNARRRSIAWLSLAGLIFLSAGIQGAQDETEAETGQQGEVGEAAEGAPGDGETASTEVFQPTEEISGRGVVSTTVLTASTEVFQPTEEISEDYAAPFPVDI